LRGHSGGLPRQSQLGMAVGSEGGTTPEKGKGKKREGEKFVSKGKKAFRTVGRLSVLGPKREHRSGRNRSRKVKCLGSAKRNLGLSPTRKRHKGVR